MHDMTAVQYQTPAQNGSERNVEPLTARWWRQAICATHPHAEWWLSSLPTERAQAAHICQQCPVIRECGHAADVEGQTFGVWGGRSR